AHDVVDAGGDVAHAFEALLAIVEVHEGLPEAGGATHVWRKYRDAVREQRLVAAVEERPLLPLGPTVEREHAGAGRAEVLRHIEPAGELEPVVRREGLEPRAHQRVEIDAGMRAPGQLSRRAVAGRK